MRSRGVSRVGTRIAVAVAVLGHNVGPQAPIRIARVITRLNIGGPSLHVIYLSQALDDGVQFESTLISGTTSTHEGDMADLARSRGVRLEMLPSLGREISPIDDLTSLARMVGLFRRLKPDVVHTHMAKAGTVGRLAALICRVPLIVHTYHGHVFHSYFGPLKTRLFVTIERALGLGTSKIVVVRDSQRDEIAVLGSPRGKSWCRSASASFNRSCALNACAASCAPSSA